jgi:hypothetical protein
MKRDQRARQIRHQLEYLIKRVNMKIQSNPTDSIGIRKAFLCWIFFLIQRSYLKMEFIKL